MTVSLHDNISTNSSNDNEAHHTAGPEYQTMPVEQLHHETMLRTYSLFTKLFDLDKPIITIKMVEFFRKREVLPVFLSYITLARPNPYVFPEDDDPEYVESECYLGLSRSERYLRHVDELKLSAKATDLMCKPSKAFAVFLTEKCFAITRELLRICEPASAGCFQHFRKAIESLLKLNPMSVIRAFTQYNGFAQLLPFIEDANVVETIFMIVSNNMLDECCKGQIVDAFRECHFISAVVSRITRADMRGSDVALDFLNNLMDQLQRDAVLCLAIREIAENNSIFETLMECALGKVDDHHNQQRTRDTKRLGALLDDVVERVKIKQYASPMRTQPQIHETEVRQKNATEALLQILRRGSAAWDAVQEAMLQHASPALQTRVMAEIYCVWSTHVLQWTSPVCVRMVELHAKRSRQRERLQEKVKRGIFDKDDIVYPLEHVGPVRLSAYTVDVPFTTVRLALMELLNEFVHCQVDCLDCIPARAWECMINWFFVYRFNNLYLVRFSTLMSTVILENHTPSMKAILAKNKFLSRAIKHFDEIEQTDNRGCMIQLLNMIRLKSDALEPTSFLKQYLSCHNEWRMFAMNLRSVTEMQTKKKFNIVLNRDKYTRPGLADWDAACEGIDLGSSYADRLGLQGLTPYIADGKRIRRMRRNLMRSASKRARKGSVTSTSAVCDDDQEEAALEELSERMRDLEAEAEELSAWNLPELANIGEDFSEIGFTRRASEDQDDDTDVDDDGSSDMSSESDDCSDAIDADKRALLFQYNDEDADADDNRLDIAEPMEMSDSDADDSSGVELDGPFVDVPIVFRVSSTHTMLTENIPMLTVTDVAAEHNHQLASKVKSPSQKLEDKENAPITQRSPGKLSSKLSSPERRFCGRDLGNFSEVIELSH
jgi:hypothetical protein